MSFAEKLEFFKLRGGLGLLLIDFAILGIIQASSFVKQWMMQDFAEKPAEDQTALYFLLIIISFDLGSHAVSIIRTVIKIILDFRFSKYLAFNLNLSLIYASINKFWDRVPIGRIVNRVTSDTSTVENGLSRKVYSFFSIVATAIQQWIMVTYTSSQWLWFAVAMNMLLCMLSYRYFMKAKLETSRCAQILRTPISHIFNESLNGLTTIRVFGKEDRIKHEFAQKINKNRSLKLMNYGLDNWLDIRFQLLSLVCTVPGFVYIVWSNVDDPNSGKIALFITNILAISSTIQDLLDAVTVLESRFVNWQRCLNFLRIHNEAGYTDIGDTITKFKKGLPYTDVGKMHVMPNWPNEGVVEFKDFRYNPFPKTPKRQVPEKTGLGPEKFNPKNSRRNQGRDSRAYRRRQKHSHVCNLQNFRELQGRNSHRRSGDLFHRPKSAPQEHHHNPARPTPFRRHSKVIFIFNQK